MNDKFTGVSPMTKVPPTAKKSRQKREWNSRHGEILEAAARLFMKLGTNGTTMQMIADEAEFSVGYLYKHFPGKKELLTEIIETQLQAYSERRRLGRTEFAGRPLAGLREELQQACRQLSEQAHLVPLILGSGTIDSELIKRLLLAFRHEDAALLEQAMDLGEISRSDPGLLAAAMDGVIWGLIGLMHQTDRIDQVPLIPEIVEELILAPLVVGKNENERKEKTK